jgi:citrate lyase subunit beta/citryl-CoA lyase
MTSFELGPALLFCPADRPDRFAKAAARADAVILDLEDAVAPASKAAARDAVVASSLDPARTIVRLNPVDTLDFAADLAAVAATGYRTVMLAKTASAAQARAVAGFDVIALVETAAGVVSVTEIAAEPNVVALMWGADDLVASLGGTSSRRADGRYRDIARHARSTVLLAAGAHGKGAIDAVYLNLADRAGLAAEARDAMASGFDASACVHPSQVAIIRAAFRPSTDDVAWARSVLAAAAGERGVFRWNGQMIDGPILKHAEGVLRRLGSPPASAPGQATSSGT